MAKGWFCGFCLPITVSHYHQTTMQGREGDLISYLCDGELHCRDASDESVYQCFQVNFSIPVFCTQTHHTFLKKKATFPKKESHFSFPLGQPGYVHSVSGLPHIGCAVPCPPLPPGRSCHDHVSQAENMSMAIYLPIVHIILIISQF